MWSPAGKGLTSWLSLVVSTVSLSLSHWYPGSGVVLDCIDSWSLHPYLLWLQTTIWSTNNMTHDSKIVRAKENIKLSHGEPSQRQASGTNPPMQVLGRGRHWVWCLTHGSTIKEINHDGLYNQACRLSCYLCHIPLFFITFDCLFKFITKYRLSNDFLNSYKVNPFYSDHVCSKLSLTLKWICCYNKMPTSTRLPHHNHLT